MNKQLEQCPVISAYEYDKCYFLIHKAYASFFGNINDKKEFKFPKAYFDIIQNYISNPLFHQFMSLVDRNYFVELYIREYTRESKFCYIFNRAMRQFEKGLFYLSYFMGPFLFELNKYVKENPKDFSFQKDMILYRNIECSIFDYYLYKININHIICFPSITSTSLINKDFITTDICKVKMIFIYKHKEGNISPGIIIKDYKGKDRKNLSLYPNEEEVILFPFTFARIRTIKILSNNKVEIYFDIINRSYYLEQILRDNVEKRYSFNDLDKQLNNLTKNK